MKRSVQAFRQAVFNALTSPQLSYMVDMTGPKTLPIANVIGKAVWLAGAGAAPDPLISFAVNVRRRGPSKLIEEREMLLRVWCVASETAGGQDCVTGLYEAVRALFHTGDQDATFAADRSRPYILNAGHLGVNIRESIEVHVSDPDFENITQRWYALAEFAVVAA